MEKKGECCGCACRHCPYEYKNVEAGVKKNLRLDPYIYNDEMLDKEVDVISWSGGKDSFLAYRSLLNEAKEPIVLLTSYDGLNLQVAHQEVKLEEIKKLLIS